MLCSKQSPGSKVEVQTGWLSQFPPVLQQISLSNSSLVHTLIFFASHSFTASQYVDCPGHVPKVSHVVPFVEQHRTPALNEGSS